MTKVKDTLVKRGPRGPYRKTRERMERETLAMEGD